jgi:glycosyltransferase involved in cell wall biosynthesis
MSREGALEGVTIGLFGHYDPHYARNRILVKALRRAGASVLPITDQRRFLSRTPRLARSAVRARLDAILVGFPGHSDVPTAKVVALAKSVPLIFSTLTSLWETSVLDRRNVSPSSIRSWRYRITDWLSCSLANTVWLDTKAHIDWFAQQYRIPTAKFRRVWVGADDEVMRPGARSGPREQFTVFFYGTFIPLQGIEHIVGAASIVRRENSQIRFMLCGGGQTYAAVRGMAKRLALDNIEFLPRRPPTKLSELMAESDVCLGIFGSGEKSQRVIPNKVFDALACARPVITGDTPAARECLIHGENAWLCRTGDPNALAAAVLESSEGEAARARIAGAGHELFKRQFSLDALARDLPPLIHEALGGRGAA